MPTSNRLKQMASQDPALGSFYEDVVEAGHEEEIDNRKRGCGHLDHNATYVRSDLDALGSPEGEIPPWVTLTTPFEYREYGERGAIIPGWKAFPGVEFSLAYANSGGSTEPEGEINAHLGRLRSDRLLGDHYGECVPARATDLLMSVGKTHWPTPGDFIEEVQTRGLNLKVPSSPNRDPPVVNPMRTRCWVIHPNGKGDDRAAIIGYAVLTRTIYTTGENATAEDPDIPQYAKEWAETGMVDLATPGPEEPAEDDPQVSVGEFYDDDGDDDIMEPVDEAEADFRERMDEADADPEQDEAQLYAEEVGTPGAEDPPEAETVVASDSDNLDVEPAGWPVLVTENSDHLLDGGGTTFCGREVGSLTVEAKGRVEDPDAYASGYDACGTCLGALKSAVAEEDDDAA